MMSFRGYKTSVPKLATNGNTTVLYPGNEGVHVYKQGAVKIVENRELILLG